jgi:hypothetical protein
MQYSFALTLMILVALLMSENNNSAEQAYKTAQLDAIAANMLVYSSAAATYAKANPGVNMMVADTSLALPSWYVNIAGVNNYISGGRAYVFHGAKPGLLDALVEKTQSVSIGINQSGILVSPKWGVTNIPIPAGVPDGSFVYVL